MLLSYSTAHSEETGEEEIEGTIITFVEESLLISNVLTIKNNYGGGQEVL